MLSSARASSNRLTVDDGATVGVDGLSRDGAAVVASQEDEASSNLAGLRRTADRCGELLDGVVVHGSGNERCPDRTRSDGIDPNATSDVLV